MKTLEYNLPRSVNTSLQTAVGTAIPMDTYGGYRIIDEVAIGIIWSEATVIFASTEIVRANVNPTNYLANTSRGTYKGYSNSKNKYR